MVVSQALERTRQARERLKLAEQEAQRKADADREATGEKTSKIRTAGIKHDLGVIIAATPMAIPTPIFALTSAPTLTQPVAQLKIVFSHITLDSVIAGCS